MGEAADHNLSHIDMQYFHLPYQDDPVLDALGLTIVHPFYNEKERLELQWRFWMGWNDLWGSTVRVIIADDHSEPGMHTYIPFKPEFDLRVYRAKKNLRHNTPGCLNMGIKEALTDWVLIMDSDCFLRLDQLSWLLNLRPNKDWIYRFHRDRVTKVKTNRLHMILGCSILFHKSAWQDVGGFDEDFTGEYTGSYSHFDNDFIFKLTKAGYRMAVPLGLWVTEYMDDMFQRPGIQTIDGMTKDDQKINKRLYYDKCAGRVPRSTFDQICRFEYERTF